MIFATGLNGVIADLIKAAATIGARAGTTVGESAEKVRETAQGNAPVASGQLRDSIEVTGSGLVREVGATARHARFVEYGTYKDSPQPFMGPAVDSHEGELVDELGEVAGDV